MDGPDDEEQQSSLPSSLIPHLYRHPPLRHYDPDTAPPRHRAPPLVPPFAPAQPPPPPPPRAPPGLYALPPVWGEGEPGPSSLRAPRADSPPRLDIYGRPPANYDRADFVRDRDPYLLPPGPPPPGSLLSQSYHTDLLPGLDPEPYFPATLPALPTPPPPGTRPFRSPASPAPSLPYARSDSYAADDDGPPQDPLPGHPRRSQSAPQHPNADDSATPRKSTAPRKTAVACNFCRGRKLRCNGARPSCSHCSARKIQCEYVLTPKRRGPGKAPKGSRSKKPDAAGPSTAAGGSERPPLPTYELAAQAPEMHPYTHVMSLDTLDVFSFQPPAPPPPGSQAQTPEREYRRRETSSEDWSGAERD